MDQELDTNELMMRYLLGELSESERSLIENRFLADNEYFERLLCVEDALIDEYVLGGLPPHQRESVEKLLLSSSRQRQELDLARDLIAAVAEPGQSKTVTRPHSLPDSGQNQRAMRQSQIPGRRFIIVARLILLALVASLLAWNIYLQIGKTKTESERAALEKENQEYRQQMNEEIRRNEILTQQLEKKSQPALPEQMAEQSPRNTTSMPGGEETVIINLFPDSAIREQSSLKVVGIRANVSRIQIRLNLEQRSDYKEYDVEISTFEERKVWSKNSVGTDQSKSDRLTLLLAADILPVDDYKIVVKARAENGRLTEVANYSFGIRKSG